MEQKTFADGLIAKKPSDAAPDFVKAKLSFKTEEFTAFLEAHTKSDGWCNIDILESKNGKWYAALNQFTKPTEAADDTQPF